MAQTKYQVTLSVDGKHAVSVQSDDPAGVTDGLIWAQDGHKKLLRLRQAEPSSRNGQVPTPHAEIASYEPLDENSNIPNCAVHEAPMALMHGRRGDFWSCHEKNPDGSWCKYRPATQAASNGAL